MPSTPAACLLPQPDRSHLRAVNRDRRPVIRRHLREALCMLMQASEYAAELGQDAWNFAVELEVLRTANVSNSDLRWLASMSYIEHAVETTRLADGGRNFRRTRPMIFPDGTCFVLTAAGSAAAGEICNPTSMAANDILEVPRRRTAMPDESPDRPQWDHQRRQVRCGGQVVKEFKLPAPNQETILTAFEEEGWPPRIDDPLPPVADLDPRRRLHDTIKALNRKQKHDVVRFMGDGNGEGVRWEFRPSRDPVPL
jgi:hypothetical protein